MVAAVQQEPAGGPLSCAVKQRGAPGEKLCDRWETLETDYAVSMRR